MARVPLLGLPVLLVLTLFGVHQAASSQDLKRARPALQDAGAAEKVMDLSSKDVHFRKMHAHRISCPLIGSFYRKGWLNPDKYGRVESSEMFSCLRKSGTSVVSAFFQASGIVSYNMSDLEQTQRNRDAGFATMWGNHDVTKGRYVNIFRMNPGDFINSQQVQHGMSTTITDGRYDDMAKPVRVKEGEGLVFTAGKEVADEQQEYDRVRKLRQQRFDEWIGAAGVLDEQGRMYAKGLMRLLRDMKDHGDHSGEFGFDPKLQSNSTCQQNVHKYHPKASEEKGGEVQEPLSEWQASLAWIGTIMGFGNVQGGLGAEYLTRDDLAGLLLDSELPPYQRRDWGFKPSDINALIEIYDIREQPALKFPPQVKDKQHYRSISTLQSERIGAHYLETFTRLGMFADAQDYSPGEYQKSDSRFTADQHKKLDDLPPVVGGHVCQPHETNNCICADCAYCNLHGPGTHGPCTPANDCKMRRIVDPGTPNVCEDYCVPLGPDGWHRGTPQFPDSEVDYGGCLSVGWTKAMFSHAQLYPNMYSQANFTTDLYKGPPPKLQLKQPTCGIACHTDTKCQMLAAADGSGCDKCAIKGVYTGFCCGSAGKPCDEGEASADAASLII